MKITSILFTIFPIFLCTFLSCDNDPYDGGCGFPPPPPFMPIQVQNNQGEDLIGNLYTQDTFHFIESTTGALIIARSEGNYVNLTFGEIDEDTDYYINWDDSDTDTVSFKWNIIDKECFDSYELTEVKHNNIELNLENGVILKQ